MSGSQTSGNETKARDWDRSTFEYALCHSISCPIQLFVDKDTLLSAINAAHDAHALAIDSKEDSIASRSKAELKALLEGMAETERSRNRRKVAEVVQFVRKQREDLVDSTDSPAPS